VRVRLIEMRILGVVLVALWFATFAILVSGYHPGGPADGIVALSSVGPVFLALAAVVWPPVARGDRAFAAIAWVAIVAALLLVPSITSIVPQLAGRGPQTLLPSAEAAYPWTLALFATALFAGLGIARRRLGETSLRRRRLLLGTGLAAILMLVAGSPFTAAAFVNEVALSDRPATSSRFGPTDPLVEPPDCNGALRAGATSRIQLQMDASVDGRRTGQAIINGIRDGADVRWTGFAATDLMLGQVGVVKVGPNAWRRSPGTTWAPVPARAVAGEDLDRQLVTVALTPANRSVAEDRGRSDIEGARARHCRVTIDGSTLREALPEIAMLIGDTDISRWRADIDYWVFTDGELGQADGRATGPASGLADDALLAELRFRMTAVDRDLPVSITAPPG
jgi:hypothetical protein